MKRKASENRDDTLTKREAMVMRCIWNADGDIPSLEIQQQLKEETGLTLERTTIATYLLHLQEKGFIERYKVGQVFYYRPLKDKDQFACMEAKDTAEQWFDGSLPALVAAFIGSGAKISPEDLKRVKEIIDGLDQ